MGEFEEEITMGISPYSAASVQRRASAAALSRASISPTIQADYIVQQQMKRARMLREIAQAEHLRAQAMLQARIAMQTAKVEITRKKTEEELAAERQGIINEINLGGGTPTQEQIQEYQSIPTEETIQVRPWTYMQAEGLQDFLTNIEPALKPLPEVGLEMIESRMGEKAVEMAPRKGYRGLDLEAGMLQSWLATAEEKLGGYIQAAGPKNLQAANELNLASGMFQAAIQKAEAQALGRAYGIGSEEEAQEKMRQALSEIEHVTGAVQEYGYEGAYRRMGSLEKRTAQAQKEIETATSFLIGKGLSFEGQGMGSIAPTFQDELSQYFSSVGDYLGFGKEQAMHPDETYLNDYNQMMHAHARWVSSGDYKTKPFSYNYMGQEVYIPPVTEEMLAQGAKAPKARELTVYSYGQAEKEQKFQETTTQEGTKIWMLPMEGVEVWPGNEHFMDYSMFQGGVEVNPTPGRGPQNPLVMGVTALAVKPEKIWKNPDTIEAAAMYGLTYEPGHQAYLNFMENAGWKILGKSVEEQLPPGVPPMPGMKRIPGYFDIAQGWVNQNLNQEALGRRGPSQFELLKNSISDVIWGAGRDIITMHGPLVDTFRPGTAKQVTEYVQGIKGPEISSPEAALPVLALEAGKGLARIPGGLIQLGAMAPTGFEMLGKGTVREGPGFLGGMIASGLVMQGAGMMESFQESPVALGAEMWGYGKVSEAALSRVRSPVGYTSFEMETLGAGGKPRASTVRSLYWQGFSREEPMLGDFSPTVKQGVRGYGSNVVEFQEPSLGRTTGKPAMKGVPGYGENVAQLALGGEEFLETVPKVRPLVTTVSRGASIPEVIFGDLAKSFPEISRSYVPKTLTQAGLLFPVLEERMAPTSFTKLVDEFEQTYPFNARQSDILAINKAREIPGKAKNAWAAGKTSLREGWGEFIKEGDITLGELRQIPLREKTIKVSPEDAFIQQFLEQGSRSFSTEDMKSLFSRNPELEEFVTLARSSHKLGDITQEGVSFKGGKAHRRGRIKTPGEIWAERQGFDDEGITLGTGRGEIPPETLGGDYTTLGSLIKPRSRKRTGRVKSPSEIWAERETSRQAFPEPQDIQMGAVREAITPDWMRKARRKISKPREPENPLQKDFAGVVKGPSARLESGKQGQKLLLKQKQVVKPKLDTKLEEKSIQDMMKAWNRQLQEEKKVLEPKKESVTTKLEPLKKKKKLQEQEVRVVWTGQPPVYDSGLPTLDIGRQRRTTTIQDEELGGVLAFTHPEAQGVLSSQKLETGILASGLASPEVKSLQASRQVPTRRTLQGILPEKVSLQKQSPGQVLELLLGQLQGQLQTPGLIQSQLQGQFQGQKIKQVQVQMPAQAQTQLQSLIQTPQQVPRTLTREIVQPIQTTKRVPFALPKAVQKWRRQDTFDMFAMRELTHPIISGRQAMFGWGKLPRLPRVSRQAARKRDAFPVLLDYHGAIRRVDRAMAGSVFKQMQQKTRRRRQGGGRIGLFGI